MRFLIIGATGRTGQLIVDEALARGHAVTALARDAASLAPRPGLTVVQGTPLSEADVAAALAAVPAEPVAAVVSALNARRASDSPFAAPGPDTPPDMLARAARGVLDALRAGSRRDDARRQQQQEQQPQPPLAPAPAPAAAKLVVMSSMGVGSSARGASWVLRALIEHSGMRDQFVDHNAVDRLVRDEAAAAAAAAAAGGSSGWGLRFVMVRPVMLSDGDRKAVKVLPEDGKGTGFLSSVSRRSVAAFLVDAAEGTQYDNMSPVIMN